MTPNHAAQHHSHNHGASKSLSHRRRFTSRPQLVLSRRIERRSWRRCPPCACVDVSFAASAESFYGCTRKHRLILLGDKCRERSCMTSVLHQLAIPYTFHCMQRLVQCCEEGSLSSPFARHMIPDTTRQACLPLAPPGFTRRACRTCLGTKYLSRRASAYDPALNPTSSTVASLGKPTLPLQVLARLLM